MSNASSSKSPAATGNKFGPFSAIAIVFGTFFGAQLLAGFFIGLYIELSGKDANQVIALITDSNFGQFLYLFMVQIVFTLGVLYWFMRKRRISAASIGLGRKPKLSDAGHGLIYTVVYFAVLFSVIAFIGKFVPAINIHQEQQIGFESVAGVVALTFVFVSLVVGPPISEEIMIRGVLYSGLRAKLQKVAAALIASFIFALPHLQPGQGAPLLYVAAIDTFILSLFLIHLREKTGALWSGILVHAIKNCLAFISIFIVGSR